MPEREFDLGKTPEKTPGQNLTTADRLVFAYSARQDFARAINIATAIEDSTYREPALANISRELVQSGRDPISPPSHFMDVASEIESWNRNDLYQNIALLQADMGDVSSALQTAELTTYGFSRFFIDLAKISKKQGVDPQPIFDRAHNNLHVNAGSTDDVRWAGLTLEAQRELGLDAPKHLIDRFRTRDRRRDEYSNGYNLKLAEAYARAGYPEDALEVWKETRNNGYHHRPETLSIIVISNGKNGIDPSELAANTIELTEALRANGQYHPEWKQAEIYANLSMAYAFYGLDPKPLIDRAMQEAQSEPSSLAAGAYGKIAKAQLSYGADARPALMLALESADDILKPGEEDESGFAGALQLISWEEIFHTQLAGEYLKDARQTLGRMDRYLSDPDIVDRIPVLLAELGKAQAKKGLSPTEINNLSQEDIREILRSPNELASQAVVYFGLEKKLL